MNDALADAIAKDVAKQLAAIGDEADYFKLCVLGEDFTEVHFKMKFGTRLGKMKQFYAERNRMPVDSFHLFYKGHLILDDDTPTLLGMKEGDEVEPRTLEKINALREQEELEKKDPLHKEKQALEKMENNNRKAMSRAAMSRNEKRKAMKEEKRKNKMNRKNNGMNADDHDHDYDNGDGRVPRLPTDYEEDEHVCCCHCALHAFGDLELQDEVESEEGSAHSPFSFLSNQKKMKNDDDCSSYEEDAKSKLMSDEYYTQFCYFMDRGRYLRSIRDKNATSTVSS